MRLAVIPARGDSSRIKDKNIRPFRGRPLIAYGLQAATDSALFDIIHVSTDSGKIAALAADLGHPVEFLREGRLARNEVPLFEVVKWVVGHYAERGRRFDEVCMVYAAAPLLEAADIQRGHDLFTAHGCRLPVVTVGRLAAPVERALTIGDDGSLSRVDRASRFRQAQELPAAYFDTGAFMFMTPGHLESPDFEAFDTMLPLVLPPHKVADINEPEDLELAEVLYLGMRARDRDGAE